jgi:predicted dehydrogenase
VDTSCILGRMQEPNRKTPGVGVVGLGEVGQIHVDAVRASQAAHLAAVADVDASLVTRYATDGTRGYGSLENLLSDPTVATISICLPHNLHFGAASSAIAAGKNVFVEKPLTISVEDGDTLVAMARSAGVALGVSHNQIFYSAHLEAKRRLEAGQLGHPVFIRLRLATGPPYGGWRASAVDAGGGLLIDAGIHRLYMATFFFGPVAGCHAVLDVPRNRGETFAVITLRFASGALGVIEANQHGPASMFEDEIEIVGSEAALRLPGLESPLGHRDALLEFSSGTWRAVPVPDDDWASTVRKSVSAYLDAVHAGATAPVDGEQAMQTMRLLHEIYESAIVLGADEAFAAAEEASPRRTWPPGGAA